MEELKRPVKRRGFYVKMRILQKHGRQQEKNLCFKYYKWVLWFSLTLYFFSSYFISHKPMPLSKTHFAHKKSNLPSRALIESNNKTFLQQPTNNNKGSINNLRVYIYELPSKYNTDWLSNDRCGNHLFASEVAIHKALLNSEVRTFDPYEADFFFVPVYVSCNFSTVNGFPAIGHARSLISSAINLISSRYPFWNRTQGYDHVFVASHDYGACFHAMVLTCLFEHDLDFEFVLVNLEAGDNKKKSFLAMSPFGQVPVLEDGDVKQVGALYRHHILKT